MQNRSRGRSPQWFGRAGEPEDRRGNQEEERMAAHLLRGLQKTEKEEEPLDIEKRETFIETEVLAMERIETTPEDFCRPDKNGQNWISMR
jgi:hypothetical protein